MKKIDDVIKDNIELFNTEEPFNGHEDRFLQKLKKQSKNNFMTKSIKVLKAAAIIILISLSTLWIYDNKIKSNNSDQFTLSDISDEYAEVEEYYINTINTNVNEIKNFNFYEQEQKKMLLDELKQMDSLYIFLQKDLKNNPTDERVINAMIHHYQMKLYLLQQIINQLNKINNQINTENYEDYEI